jgi:soluble lytic murein transglycosylase-like protein
VLINGVTWWRPQVLQALNAWLALDPVGIDAILSTAGLTRDLFVEVILGIIQHESAGNASAIGDGGCSFGLMQFNWCVRQSAAGRLELQYPYDMGNGQVMMRTVSYSSQLYDPLINIGVGMRFFLKQLDSFGDVPLAIEAYNNPNRSFFNQAYLDAVLTALGMTPEFFADLKKKRKSTVPGSWWQRLWDFFSTLFSNVRGGKANAKG